MFPVSVTKVNAIFCFIYCYFITFVCHIIDIRYVSLELLCSYVYIQFYFCHTYLIEAYMHMYIYMCNDKCMGTCKIQEKIDRPAKYTKL